MNPNDYAYPGKELELFEKATNWKKYWASLVRPYISGDVLEVGAGTGVNTVYLHNSKVNSWHLLEPDPYMAGSLQQKNERGELPAGCRVTTGTNTALPPESRFDCILYIDVLEHIADDRQELAFAAGMLREGGRLIVLAPAHPFLMSPFDDAIGHYRRYNKKMLQSIRPSGLSDVQLFYADSAGLIASMANRYFLRKRLPGKSQISFWDNCLIPVSRMTDMICLRRLGKTVIAIWQKQHSSRVYK